jgi:hypothetical protein
VASAASRNAFSFESLIGSTRLRSARDGERRRRARPRGERGRTLPPRRYGRVKTNSAVPRGTPYISGAYPSTQPPHPVGTATYCLPRTL